MKKKILFLVSIAILLLTSCSSKDKNIAISSKDIEFKPIKTQVSRSFQRTEAYGEFVGKDSKSKRKDYARLLVSSGLTEATGIEVKKIIRENNRLNVYIESSFQENRNNLSIQQAILEIRTKHIEPLDKLSINIIDEENSPIQVKVGINDAIGKINSHFKLMSTSTPKTELIKKDDDLVWHIEYDSLFHKDDENIPLVKFSCNVDANKGDILDYEKEVIADPIDLGQIVTSIGNNILIYKKSVLNSTENTSKQELWLYNSKKDEKKLVFSSDKKIINVQSNPSGSMVSFIETNDETSNLYLIKAGSKNPKKLTLENDLKPNIVTWVDDENLIIVKKTKGHSLIHKYNLITEDIEDIQNLNMNICSLQYRNNNFIFTEEAPDLTNKKIFLTKDFQNKLEIGDGYSPKFLNDHTIVYMNDREDSHENEILFYDIAREAKVHSIDGLISNFQVVDDEKIAYLTRESYYNDFLLYLYDYRTDQTNFLTKSINNKGHLSLDKGIFYLNATSPFENENNQVIYPVKIDIKKD